MPEGIGAFLPPGPQDRYNRSSVHEAGEGQEENSVRSGLWIRVGQAFYDK